MYPFIFFFLILFPTMVYTRRLDIVPMLYGRTLLFIRSKLSSLHLVTRNSQSILLPLPLSNQKSVLYTVEYCVQSLSRVQLFVMARTVAQQAPLSMEFSRQDYWSGLPFPLPGYLPNPGIEPMSLASLALAGRFFTTVPPGKPTMEYQSAIKKNAMLPFAATWMQLEIIILSIVSPTEKDKYHMTSLISGI